MSRWSLCSVGKYKCNKALSFFKRLVASWVSTEPFQRGNIFFITRLLQSMFVTVLRLWFCFILQNVILLSENCCCLAVCEWIASRSYLKMHLFGWFCCVQFAMGIVCLNCFLSSLRQSAYPLTPAFRPL